MITNRIKFVVLGLAVVALTAGFRYHGKALLQTSPVFKRCAALVTPRSVFAQSGVLWSANMETAGQDLSQWYFSLNSDHLEIPTPVPCFSISITNAI